MSERQARVSQSGCGIFLTASELRALGIDPDDADAVAYSVTDSRVEVTAPGGGDE